MDRSFLEKVSVFYNNEINSLDQLSPICSLKEYKAGTLLAKPDIHTKKAAFIKKGICKYYHKGPNDEEIVFSFRSTPAFIPYAASGFFLNEPSQVFCEVVTDLEVYEMESEDLFRLADAHPNLYFMLLQLVTTVYQEKETKEFSVMEKTSTERYLEFVQKYPELIDQIPLRNIASYLNIQPGSLSRIRRKIKPNS